MPRYRHLLVPTAGQARSYTSTLKPRNQVNNPPRNRAAHGGALLNQLQGITNTPLTQIAKRDGSGFYQSPSLTITFESDPDFRLRFESLDLQASGIELLSVVTDEANKTAATIRVPVGKVATLVKRLEKYRDSDPNAAIPEGKKRKPNDYATLVESIASIKLATLRELWTDQPADYPAANVPITWEVWLRQADEGEGDSFAILSDAAGDLGYVIASNPLHFIDRTVVLVRGTREQLSLGAEVLGVSAEVRKAKVAADFFEKLKLPEQHGWIANLVNRLTPAAAGAPVVSLLDTGVNHGHPLLFPVIDPATDLHAHKPAWGVHDTGPHGTSMAGLALYGDLTPVLAGNGDVQLSHGIESHKLINDRDQHDPPLFGEVTVEGINRLEAGVQRPRIYCMAVTALDSSKGRPSSWSAAIDKACSGAEDDVRRLVLISAGNTDPTHHGQYPDSNEVQAIQDPAQSWNALTIGGYTDKALIDHTVSPGWTPVAQPGDISPFSTTSVLWSSPFKAPYKPDIVMEAGNLGRSGPAAQPNELPELMVLSTNHQFAAGDRPFTTMGETSGATALAANLAAQLAARYPTFTPETLRGLLVHSARWTDPMRARAKKADGTLDCDRLLRLFGYGIPDEPELFTSANNSLTLIVQDELQPFAKDPKRGLISQDMKVHALPWPADVLTALPLGTQVQMRVTLSYFVEPSPGERGWDRKYGYPSHGLRFKVQRAAETLADFQARTNREDQEEDYVHDPVGETGEWVMGAANPRRGSIHSNVWRGSAQELANRANIIVHPSIGWWKTRPKEHRYDRMARYSLIVSITTPDQATDIYTPVATQIGVPIEIAI